MKEDEGQIRSRTSTTALYGRGIAAGTGMTLYALFPTQAWPNWVAQGVAAGLAWILVSSLISRWIRMSIARITTIGAILGFGVLLGAAWMRIEWLGIAAITAVGVNRLEWILSTLGPHERRDLQANRE